MNLPSSVETPAFHPGAASTLTAFVLAVPGSKERDAGRPAAGDTGDNLDRVLVHLNRHDSHAFPSVHRNDYRIANALETVMFGKESMPKIADVLEADNLARLAAQLAGMATIVALSAPAIRGVREAGLRLTYNHVTHPSMRGLNNRFPGLGEDVKQKRWRVEERCRRYAAELIASRT